MTRFPVLLGGVLLASALSPLSVQAKTLAYWNFEGAPAQPLGAGPGVADLSRSGNALLSSNAFSQPLEAADAPFSSVPQLGAPNRASAEFRGDDELVSGGSTLDSFNFSPTGSNAWTVEFSLRLQAFDGVTRLLGRDGNTPGGERRGPLQLVAVNPDGGEKYDLRVEIVDGANRFLAVISPTSFQTRRWYNVAATATSDELKLYADCLDGRGYQLVGRQAIRGALSTVSGPFAIGRGWNNGPAENMNGRLDEVRLSDRALSPSQFLFSTPQGAGVSAPLVAAPPARDVKLFFGADPDARAFGKTYYLYPTGNYLGTGNNWVFYAFSSPDLKNWTRTPPILNFNDIAWIYADGNPTHLPWAPSIEQQNGKFYFYYAVGPQGATPSRIGVAVSDSPTGPFKDSGAALVTGGGGFEAIDPMVFTDPRTGQSYLYAGGSAGAKLRVWQLTPDLLHLSREIPVATPPKFTEGAFMHFTNGMYYLSYSHGGWHSPSYSVHYATAPSPIGPWTYHGPILVSDETRKGPGHHSFFRDPQTGRWFIAYHRWQSARAGGDPFGSGKRSLAIAPILYEPNGEIAPIQMNDAVPVLR